MDNKNETSLIRYIWNHIRNEDVQYNVILGMFFFFSNSLSQHNSLYKFTSNRNSLVKTLKVIHKKYFPVSIAVKERLFKNSSRRQLKAQKREMTKSLTPG